MGTQQKLKLDTIFPGPGVECDWSINGYTFRQGNSKQEEFVHWRERNSSP